MQFGVATYSEQANKQTALHELLLAFGFILFLINDYKYTLFSVEWPFAETSRMLQPSIRTWMENQS